MLKFLSLTALASALVLSTAALAPASAQHRGGYGFAGGGGGHYHFSQRHTGRISGHSRPNYVGRLHQLGRQPHSQYSHWRHGSHNGAHYPLHWRHGSHGMRYVHWRHGSSGWHWRHGSYGWAYGVPVAVGVAGVAAYEASGPAPVCTCLTKDYLEDGSVRFTDTCTKEFAISMPPEQAPVK